MKVERKSGSGMNPNEFQMGERGGQIKKAGKDTKTQGRTDSK